MNTHESISAYDFLFWQCRIRQQSVRQSDGRPTSGMCPVVSLKNGTQLGQIITLITKQIPENITAQFQHMIKKTQDPTERWESAVTLLSSAYYQDAKEFSENLTALFGRDSDTCKKLIEAAQCTLDFEQNNQRFRLPCSIVDLQSDDPFYQFTFWHNSLFNPAMPGDVHVLAFTPDWSEATSEKLS